MRGRAGSVALSVLATALFLAACGSGGADPERAAHKCPVPVHYTKQQLDDIQKALEKLPKDSILLQAMQDYEQERDDLRFCR